MVHHHEENVDVDILSIHKIVESMETISNNDENSKYQYYLFEVIDLLEKVKLLETKRYTFFPITTTIASTDNDYSGTEKNHDHLIEQYLAILEEYFPNKYTSLYKSINSKNEDDSLGVLQSLTNKNNKDFQQCRCKKKKEKDVSSTTIICDNHFLACKDCGCLIKWNTPNLQVGMSFKDIERVSLQTKYSYDNAMHFNLLLKRFQGKEKTKIPQSVFKKIIESLAAYNLITENYEYNEEESDDVKKRVFQKVGKEHILRILKDLRLTGYYDNVTSIYKQLTGKKVPSLSAELETMLMNDFNTLLELYTTFYKTCRKNFLSNQYVLYLLLRKHNILLKKEEFSFLKSTDRQTFHDTVASKLFSHLGWNFKPVF